MCTRFTIASTAAALEQEMQAEFQYSYKKIYNAHFGMELPVMLAGEENKIVFVNISGECTINIYSELGELVQTIEHADGSGSQDWLLTTSSNQFIVSGIYIAVITDNITGDREIAKFSIIR